MCVCVCVGGREGGVRVRVAVVRVVLTKKMR